VRSCPRCLASYDEGLEFCGIDGAELIETELDPLLGVEIDRYQILELLGRGAMGAVYRARHLSLGRDFALKVLSGSFAANPHGLARFHREADALSKVRHSNIVSVVDFVTTPEGLNILIMDYLPGRTLYAAIAEEAPFTPERSANIARQIAAGLGAAHANELVHRDVKPSNVLLVAEGRGEVVKLLDFGVVTLEKQSDTAERLTGDGRVVGTPTYMAPEQAREGPVTHAADLYALGVVLYEMLSGKPPFDSKTVTEILVKHAVEPPPPLQAARGMEKIALQLLAKDVRDRPASAEAVIEEIDALVESWARPPSVVAPPPVKRRTKWPIAAGVSLAAMMVAGFVWTRNDAVSEPITHMEEVVEEEPEDEPEQPELAAPILKASEPVRPRRRAAKREESITKDVLHKRLDAVMTTLRGAAREIPANLAKECDDEYLVLRVAVNDAKNERALLQAAKRVRRLERKIAALRRG
jgi:serine/threonine-protein kinase